MADTIHRRYIIIDNDTLVGYNYLKKKFYVTNKETTTYRNTAIQTVRVLNVLGIDNYTILSILGISEGKATADIGSEHLTDLNILSYTAEKLKEAIYDNYETLEKVYYTLEDTGSYIRTLQFNDWIGYPLEIDCDTGNIFIKNTNIVYSLELNQSPENRVSRFCSFYLETLGLEIDSELMATFYFMLVNQYTKPNFYNILSANTEKNTYKFTNSFGMNNFNNISAITCEGTKNPNDKYDSQYLTGIDTIDIENNLINLQTPIDPSKYKDLMEDSKILIQGSTVTEGDAVYTTDGEFTISQLINSSLGNRNWCGLTFADDKVTALSVDGYMVESADGVTWGTPNLVDKLRGHEWVDISYGNGTLMAIDKLGYIATRTGNSEWEVEQPENLTAQEWTGLTFVSTMNKFMALSYYGYYSLSDNWDTPELLWSDAAYASMPKEEKIGWVDLKYYSTSDSEHYLIAINNLGAYSTALVGSSLSKFDSPELIKNKIATNTWSCVAYGNDKLMALSSSGYVGSGYPQENGYIYWEVTQNDNLGNNSWSNVIFVEGEESKFIALSSIGYLSTNKDDYWEEATLKSDDKIATFRVAEPLLYNYTYPYPTCYVQSVDCPIISMERLKNIIKIKKEDLPENLAVGNTIHVEGTAVVKAQEEISCDGSYTITDIASQVKQISDVVVSMGQVMEDNATKNIIEIDTDTTELIVGNVIKITGTGTKGDKEYTIENIIPASNEVPYIKLEVTEDIPCTYGPIVVTQGVPVTLISTAATNAIEVPASYNVSVNAGDLLNIKYSSTVSADYTVVKVIQYPSGNRTFTLDGVVQKNYTQVDLTVTSMSKVMLNYSEELYYNIYVEESIPADFVSTPDYQGSFYKEVFVGNVIGIDSYESSQSLITLDSIAPNIKLDSYEDNIGDIDRPGSILYIYILGERYISMVQNVYKNRQVLIGAIDSTPYISQMPPRAIVDLQVPRGDTLLTITNEHSHMEDLVPLGSFMLDDFTQCEDYVELLQQMDREAFARVSHIPDLEDSINDKMFQELKKNSVLKTIGDIKVLFKGVYTAIYPAE